MVDVMTKTLAKDVMATLGYAGAFAGRGRLDTEEPAKTNFTLDRHDVHIRDVRGLERERHSLARNGFEFVRHHCPGTKDPELFDLGDAKEVSPTGALAAYAADVGAFVKERVGASYIVPQVGSFISRTSARAPKPTWAATANMVHLDYTPEAARLFMQWNEDVFGPVPVNYNRYAFIQTWRALSRGPQDNVLAICDGASVPPEDGVEIDAAMGPPDVPGKCFPFRLCKYREGHQWYYLSDMTGDDLLLFKGYDSREPRAMNAMHTAFDNPLAGEDAEPRRSIEGRFIAFFA